MTGKPYGTTLDYKDYAALERKLKGHCLPECLASHLFRSPAKGLSTQKFSRLFNSFPLTSTSAFNQPIS